MIPRTLEPVIQQDLAEKMVFLAGPRQVGKTTLARQILARDPDGLYLNWDNRTDRAEIRMARWPGGNATVVLDELHKWRGWKGWLKGEFDKHRPRLRFLITGSARLDLYRRGSDSLQGRYHHFRLHPLTLAEIESGSAWSPPEPHDELPIHVRGGSSTLLSLLRFGGFPEPWTAQSDRTLRRWQKDRLDRVFREDVRDLEAVRDLSTIQTLAELLPDHIGSPLSINALREDLDSSHRAVSHWMEILDRLYLTFRVSPFNTRRARTLKKMPKVYFWDWTMAPAGGARFENLVAVHLLKLCHALEDIEGHRAELWYLRERGGREVDFLVTVDGKPWFAVEAKLKQGPVAPAIPYFATRLSIPYSYQVSLEAARDLRERGVRSLGADRFLGALA